MKKLMIAAAIVCAAVVSQAASFQWFAYGVNGYESQVPYSGAAMLYAYDSSGGLVESFSGSMTAGMINQYVSSDKFTEGAMYSFSYTMKDEDGNVFTASYPAVQAQSKSTPTLSFMSSGSWAAPEPTSGMLLLIGVGALALRRRRA